jgi:hypothetical protein
MTIKSAKQINLPKIKQKILFVANASSSHTLSWINLLEDCGFDVTLFGVGGTVSSTELPFRLISSGTCQRRSLEFKYVRWHAENFCRRIKSGESRIRILNSLSHLCGDNAFWFKGFDEELLALTIRKWRPDIIHTLGIEASSQIYLNARKRFSLEGNGKWVVTAWGGSDFELVRHDPALQGGIEVVLNDCDRFIADNDPAYRYACNMGLDPSKIIPRVRTPGTGGVNIERLRSLRTSPPSAQRTILIPKAYECTFSKVLPVFEALKLCWERISPCRVQMTAYNEESAAWYRTLPKHIRACCVLEQRIPHEQLLESMAHARILLAPSLIDGIPNTLYEAMATGAFPVFSPLDTIRDIVTEGTNILFARNLYPGEIADALVRAMTDDNLVDAAAEINLQLVRSLADRSQVRDDVVAFYRSLVPVRGIA